MCHNRSAENIISMEATPALAPASALLYSIIHETHVHPQRIEPLGLLGLLGPDMQDSKWAGTAIAANSKSCHPHIRNGPCLSAGWRCVTHLILFLPPKRKPIERCRYICASRCCCCPCNCHTLNAYAILRKPQNPSKNTLKHRCIPPLPITFYGSQPKMHFRYKDLGGYFSGPLSIFASSILQAFSSSQMRCVSIWCRGVLLLDQIL